MNINYTVLIFCIKNTLIRDCHKNDKSVIYNKRALQWLAQREMLFKLPLPTTTMCGKFGSEFET